MRFTCTSKERLRCDGDACAFGDERCEPSLVGELRPAPLPLELCVVAERFELAEQIQVAQPAVADPFGDELG
jgi:hypothetical protein